MIARLVGATHLGEAYSGREMIFYPQNDSSLQQAEVCPAGYGVQKGVGTKRWLARDPGISVERDFPNGVTSLAIGLQTPVLEAEWSVGWNCFGVRIRHAASPVYDPNYSGPLVASRTVVSGRTRVPKVLGLFPDLVLESKHIDAELVHCGTSMLPTHTRYRPPRNTTRRHVGRPGHTSGHRASCRTPPAGRRASPRPRA